jgi:hypothetical protein
LAPSPYHARQVCRHAYKILFNDTVRIQIATGKIAIRLRHPNDRWPFPFVMSGFAREVSIMRESVVLITGATAAAFTSAGAHFIDARSVARSSCSGVARHD